MRRSFYEYIKKEIDDIRFESENLDKDILFLPEFFRVLCEMADESLIYEEFHSLIGKALAYFVLPNDVISEDVYGVMGYMDDMFVCCAVLRKIYDKYPGDVIKHWNRHEDFYKTLDICEFKARKVLDENNLLDKTLEFAGLMEK